MNRDLKSKSAAFLTATLLCLEICFVQLPVQAAVHIWNRTSDVSWHDLSDTLDEVKVNEN